MRKNFACLAKLVTRAGEKGDQVAIRVMKECAGQLALIVTTCANNLKMGNDPYKIVAGSMVADPKSRYHQFTRDAIKRIHPQTQLVPPKFEPVIGAALIALGELNVEWSQEIIENIEKSWTGHS